MSPDIRIVFLLVVPDYEPLEASPLQGFAPSLCQNSELLVHLHVCPSDVVSFSKLPSAFNVARKIAGQAPIHWLPLNPAAVKSLQFGPEAPFVFLLLPEGEDPKQYEAWRQASYGLPLIIAPKDGDVSYSDFSLATIRNHVLGVAETVGDQWGSAVRKKIVQLISEWSPPDERDLGFTIGGHNAFLPNVMALSAMGFKSPVTHRLAAKEDIAPYVDGILLTAGAILDERKRIGDVPAFRLHPPTPDLLLFAPSMYPHMRKIEHENNLGGIDPELTKKTIKVLYDQEGYRFELKKRDWDVFGIHPEMEIPKPHPFVHVRQEELHLGTAAVGLLAASEASAVIRLPNGVNRTAGQVRQLAANWRGANASPHKRLKTFEQVQSRLRSAVPQAFIKLINRAEHGVRIISDAPLEWLDIDGIPLGIKYDTARIPSTPGNLLIQNLANLSHLRLRPDAFSEVLLISALEKGDPLSKLMPQALGVFGDLLHDRISVRSVDVSSRAELVEALNQFSGALVIFDGHGSHPRDEQAKLWVKDEAVDVWGLRSEIDRCPPLVVLSACDTHAADRNHATAATGFLTLGARAVVGSFLPLPGPQASVFIARLLYRAAEYIPTVIEMNDRAVSWSKVVGGLLRMTLQTDFLRLLEAKKLISEKQYLSIHSKGNMWINADFPDAFERLKKEVISCGVPEHQVNLQFRTAIAVSTASAYVHIGRPETVYFDSQDRIDDQLRDLPTASKIKHVTK